MKNLFNIIGIIFIILLVAWGLRSVFPKVKPVTMPGAIHYVGMDSTQIRQEIEKVLIPKMNQLQTWIWNLAHEKPNQIETTYILIPPSVQLIIDSMVKITNLTYDSRSQILDLIYQRVGDSGVIPMKVRNVKPYNIKLKPTKIGIDLMWDKPHIFGLSAELGFGVHKDILKLNQINFNDVLLHGGLDIKTRWNYGLKNNLDVFKGNSGSVIYTGILYRNWDIFK
jgi:hypothetical protein